MCLRFCLGLRFSASGQLSYGRQQKEESDANQHIPITAESALRRNDIDQRGDDRGVVTIGSLVFGSDEYRIAAAPQGGKICNAARPFMLFARSERHAWGN